MPRRVCLAQFVRSSGHEGREPRPSRAATTTPGRRRSLPPERLAGPTALVEGLHGQLGHRPRASSRTTRLHPRCLPGFTVLRSARRPRAFGRPPRGSARVVRSSPLGSFRRDWRLIGGQNRQNHHDSGMPRPEGRQTHYPRHNQNISNCRTSSLCFAEHLPFI